MSSTRLSPLHSLHSGFLSVLWKHYAPHSALKQASSSSHFTLQNFSLFLTFLRKAFSSNRSDPPILLWNSLTHTHKHTQVLLYNTYYILDLLLCLCVFCRQLPRQHPGITTSLEGHSCVVPPSHWPRVDLCDEQKKTEVTSETWFSETVDSMLISLSDSHHLLQGDALSWGALCRGHHADRTTAWWVSMKCLLQSLSERQRLQRLSTTCTQSPKTLWARPTWPTVLLLPIP